MDQGLKNKTKLKFIHTADIHLYSPFNFLGEKASTLQKNLLQAVERIVDYAIIRQVDLVVLAGDIFDIPNVTQQEFNIFRDLVYDLSDNKIQVVILPGNHDSQYGVSMFNTPNIFQGDPNIFVVSASSKELKLDKINTTIYSKLEINDGSVDKTRFNIGLYHLGLDIPGLIGNPTAAFSDQESDSSRTIKKEYLMSLPLDYIALGDWHSYQKVAENIYYSGAPEWTSYSDSDYGTVNLVELSMEQSKNKVLTVERLKTGRIKSDKLEINMSYIRNLEEIRMQVLKNNSEYLIRKVLINGDNKININVGGIINELKKNFFYLFVEDNSKVLRTVNYNNLNLLQREFVRLIDGEIKLTEDESRLKLLEEAKRVGLLKLE